ncbi:MAG: nuclear transport factor 2 family protein [Myxococcota bacterium]
MAATETPDLREDEARLRDLALRYARMMDNLSFDDLPTVFADDGVLSGPGYEMTGHDQLRAGLQSLDQFEATLHGVLNTYFEIDGDRATGEVYCVANHVHQVDGLPFKLDMGIRYADEYTRKGEIWVIQRRVFNMVWETDTPMRVSADGKPQAAA